MTYLLFYNKLKPKMDDKTIRFYLDFLLKEIRIEQHNK
jgi:hypothetical protein